MKISLIITTYNWKEALELVLCSARRQSRLPDEILIADDGSREDTRELIESVAPKMPVPTLHVWHEDEGFRRSAILNRAIGQAVGDYLIQVDGDVILHKHFVRDHEGFAKPGRFCAGSRTHLSEELTREVFHSKRIDFRSWERGIKRPINAMRIPWLAHLLYPEAARYDDIRGSNLAYWRDDAIAANGYNEDIAGWGREDTEFVARLTFNGVKRRKIKFAAKQYHLYHPEASRAQLDDNDAILARTIDERLTRCAHGIDSAQAAT